MDELPPNKFKFEIQDAEYDIAGIPTENIFGCLTGNV